MLPGQVFVIIQVRMWGTCDTPVGTNTAAPRNVMPSVVEHANTLNEYLSKPHPCLPASPGSFLPSEGSPTDAPRALSRVLRGLSPKSLRGSLREAGASGARKRTSMGKRREEWESLASPSTSTDDSGQGWTCSFASLRGVNKAAEMEDDRCKSGENF